MQLHFKGNEMTQTVQLITLLHLKIEHFYNAVDWFSLGLCNLLCMTFEVTVYMVHWLRKDLGWSNLFYIQHIVQYLLIFIVYCFHTRKQCPHCFTVFISKIELLFFVFLDVPGAVSPPSTITFHFVQLWVL